MFELEKLRKIPLGIWAQSALYLAAGVNHFINPEFYLALIPPYLPEPLVLNGIAGIAEITGAIGLLLPKFRYAAATGLVLMLTAFIPAHVFMITEGGCLPNGVCAPLWAAWLRLIPMQPLLMSWVWKYRNR